MAATNRKRSIANTLIYEGGLSMIRSDPGNWTGGKVGVGELKGTNFGIAANTYPNHDIKHLTKDQAIAIYERDYWPKVGGDELPMGVDQVAFDAGMNSGPSRGLMWVGKAAGLTANFTAVNVARAVKAKPDTIAVIKRACANRMGFLKSLGTFGKFGSGWTRRVTQMEAIGVKMALEVKTPAAVNDNLKREAVKAGNESSAGTKKAATAATAGSGSVGVATIPEGTSESLFSFGWIAYAAIGIVVVLVLVTVALFVWQAWKDRLRKEAYEDAAAGRIGEAA